jgi:hypothetical protein
MREISPSFAPREDGQKMTNQSEKLCHDGSESISWLLGDYGFDP